MKPDQFTLDEGKVIAFLYERQDVDGGAPKQYQFEKVMRDTKLDVKPLDKAISFLRAAGLIDQIQQNTFSDSGYRGPIRLTDNGQLFARELETRFDDEMTAETTAEQEKWGPLTLKAIGLLNSVSEKLFIALAVEALKRRMDGGY